MGATNVDVTVNSTDFNFGGSAVQGGDYAVANVPFTIPAGVVDYSNLFLYPLQNSTAVGSLSIWVTNLGGVGYTVTNNVASSTLQLKAQPPGTVLFSENFENDPTGSNWNVIFASYTNSVPDYNVLFDYDYVVGGGPFAITPPIPAAPNSTNGDTKGLLLTVNKGDSYAIAAALNLYLKNKNFSGDFALRFDMYLLRNSVSTAQSRLENAIFGINHGGNRTNWFRNAVTGTDLPGSPTASDGLWFDIGADGSGGGGAYDFGAWSSPTYTNTAGVIGPTHFINIAASTERQVFKNPPYDAGPAAGGAPANTVLSATPTWAEVEISQIGNRITWKINNSVIYSYLNTNLTQFGVTPANNVAYTNGTIMLGYNDGWDDIANGSPSSGEGCVIYDNVRVVSVSAPAILAQPTSIVAPAGKATNLTVTASTVTGTTSYQWQRFGTNLPGATGATLDFPSLAFANFGTYRVIVGDGAYATTSADATVLPPAPTVSNPAGKAVPFGLATTLSVVGSSLSGVTNYQWMLGTANVSGANYSGITTPTLGIASMRSTNAGAYKVRVSDGYTIVTSTVANLTLAVQPLITSSLSGQTLTLSLPTEIGPTYVLEWKGALTNGAWNLLSTHPGTGNPVIVPTGTAGDAERYFRTRME